MTSDDGSVRIWEPDNSDKPDLILRGHRSATWTVEFSRETGLLASASGESVRIWPLKPALHPSKLPAAPERFGAVSDETALAMARSAVRASRADWALAVTGIAGPTGGSPDKPVGTVCFAWAGPAGAEASRWLIPGDRAGIRRESVRIVLEGLLDRLA